MRDKILAAISNTSANEDLWPHKKEEIADAVMEVVSAQWISVEDRLPEVSKSGIATVLVLCESTPFVMEYITNDDGTPAKFYFSTNWPIRIFHDATDDVTHWMPLPPPPQSLTARKG